MAQVSWALITTNVYNNPNNQPVLDFPLPAIDLHNVPNNFSFSVAFALIGLNESKRYILKIQMYEPDEKQPLLEGEIGIDHKYNEDENNSSFFSDVNMQNFQFNKFGVHKIIFSIDELQSHTIYFDVRRAKNATR